MSALQLLRLTELYGDLTKVQRLIAVLTRAFPNFGAAVVRVVASIRNGEGAATAFKTALSGLGNVIKAHPILTVIAAITAVVTVVKGINNLIEEHKKKIREAQDASIEASKAIIDETNSLEKNYITINKYIKRTDLTQKQEADFKSAVDDAAEALGGKTTALYEAEAAQDTYLRKLKETTDEEIENAKQEAKIAKDAAAKNLASTSGYYEGIVKHSLTIDSITNKDGESLLAHGLFASTMKDYVDEESDHVKISLFKDRTSYNKDDADEIIKFYYKLIEARKELADQDLTTNTYYEQADVLINRLQQDVETYVQTRYDETKLNYEATNGIPQTIEEYKALRDAVLEGTDGSKEYQEVVEGLLRNDFSDVLDIAGFDSAIEKENIFLQKLKETESLSEDAKNQVIDWYNSLSDDDKNIVYTIQTQFDRDELETQLRELSEGGTVDLKARPVIDTSELAKAGWDIESGGKATVFTSTYSNEDGTLAMNFTPIIVDENGNYKGVLTPEELTEYAEGVIAGTRTDDLRLKIGAEFTGENAIENADRVAQKIHEMHEWYYLNDDSANWTLEQWEDAIANWEIPESEKIHFSDLMADEDFNSVLKDFKDNFVLISDALDDLQNDSLKTSDKWELITEKFPELAGRTGDLKEALTELQDQLKDDALAALAEELEYMDTDADKEALQGVFDTLLEFASNSSEIEDVTASLSKLNSELDSLEDTYSDIKDVIDDYNENGYLTLDNLQSIMDLEPQYVNLLIGENGQINLNNQAYKDYIATKAKLLLLNELQDLYQNVLDMKIEEAQAYANAKAYDVETRSVKDLLIATSQLYLEKAKAKDLANNTTVYTDAMNRSFLTGANYAAMVDSYINSLSTSQNEFSVSTEQATSALEAEKDALEAQKDALNDSKDALEDYKDGLSDAQSKIKDLIDLVQDYIKQMKENEMDALSDQIDALEEQKDNYSEIISQKKEAIELAKQEREEAEKLSDLQQAVAKDTLSLAVANLDDSSAGRKAQKVAKDKLIQSNKDLQDELNQQAYDKRIEALEQDEEDYSNHIDKRIEALNKEKDAIQEYLDNVRQLYEDACNMIDNDTGDLYGKLWNDYVYPYTTQTRAEFDNLWYSAQEAIQRYIGDNDSLIGVMEYLQTEIYNTDEQIGELELQIGDLETAIDNTNSMIDNTSTSIDNVSTSLDGLGTTIANYMAQLAELQAAANNIDVNPNPGGEKTKFYVTHNGKTYETGYNYNGDTEGNRLLAAAELTKQIAKDVSGFDQYGLGIVQGYLGVGTSGAKEWYVDLNGHRYTAVSKTKDNAIKQIMAQGIDPRAGYYVRDHIQHYATGTYSSVGGVAITQENNKLEEIFGKLQNGQYTMLSEGSHVLDSQATTNLHRFADNPPEFVAQALNYSGYLGKVENAARNVVRNIDNHSSGNTEVSAPISISIQGDASQSTVKAIEKAGREIETRIIKKLVRFGNINKKPMY